MDVVLQAALVGLIQGLTEFIPISSSAHLELVPWMAGWDEGGLVGSLAFDVFLHLGTLVALVSYFFRDWVRYIGAWFASVRERRIGADPDRRLAWLLLAATIPAAIIGFAFEGFIEDTFHGGGDGSRLAIAGFLILGAAALWLADRLGARRRELTEVTAPTALTIGFSQALALLPGISRSGATIAAGLALGLTREAAARFSFLLATPIVVGAAVLKGRYLFEPGHAAQVLAGMVTAAVFGFASIRFLLAYVRTRDYRPFVYYRLLFAALVAAVLFVRGGGAG